MFQAGHDILIVISRLSTAFFFRPPEYILISYLSHIYIQISPCDLDKSLTKTVMAFYVLSFKYF